MIANTASATEFQSSVSKRILVIVSSASIAADGKPTGTWFEEFATPYEVWTQQGYEIVVASPAGGVAPIDPSSLRNWVETPASLNAKKVLSNTIPLSTMESDAGFDAVFLPGGHGPLVDLATDKKNIALVSEFARHGKAVISVCHGPAGLVGATLANGAPIVQGKKVTAFSDEEEGGRHVPFSVEQKIRDLGGLYSKAGRYQAYAITDGNLITGQNPASSILVAQQTITWLNESRSVK